MTSEPHGTVNNVPGTYTRGSPVGDAKHGVLASTSPVALGGELAVP